MRSYKVGVLGATGAVGQKFIRLLDGHPWFRLTEVYASDRSRGKSYAEAVHWLEDGDVPAAARDLEVKAGQAELDADILFSAIPGGKAGPVERAYAAQGKFVFTNARDLRMEDDVPLVIAEVNPDHLAMVAAARRGDAGFVVANGNCTTITLALTLKPLVDAFDVTAVSMVSMQALSGAGYPGVPSLDIMGNVIPFIRNEEERVLLETPKFLGTLDGTRVRPASFSLAATCTRVPVVEGHTEVVSVRTGGRIDPVDVAAAFASFKGRPQELGLPSAPAQPIIVRPEADRPQPKKDWSTGRGMSAVVGRIAPDPVMGGFRYVAMASNTIRGAAGGSLLNAELCAAEGLLDG